MFLLNNYLVIGGSSRTYIKITNLVICRSDLDITHEEAEIIIAQQLLIQYKDETWTPLMRRLMSLLYNSVSYNSPRLNTWLFYPAVEFLAEKKKRHHNDHNGILVRQQAVLDIEKTDDKHAAIIDNFAGCTYIVWM